MRKSLRLRGEQQRQLRRIDKEFASPSLPRSKSQSHNREERKTFNVEHTQCMPSKWEEIDRHLPFPDEVHQELLVMSPSQA